MRPNSKNSISSESESFRRQEAEGGDIGSPAPRESTRLELPSIALPKGGGAIKGIEEKFQVNAVNGTASFGIPLPLSPARLMPSVGLGYNSGGGNSVFGLGWQLGIPSIARKTEKFLPTYQDEEDSDTFILSGAEDLVRVLKEQGGDWKQSTTQRSEAGADYTVAAYRPRIEGLFARIERWKNDASGETHWRTVSKDNVHSYFGLTAESRVADPHDPSRVFEWLLCRTHDDKGSVCLYQYKKEDFVGIGNALNEKHRKGNCTQTYPKKVLYGNKDPYYLGDDLPTEDDFMFKVIFDYGEHDLSPNIPKDIDQEKRPGLVEKTPFQPTAPASKSGPTGAVAGCLLFIASTNCPTAPT